ncbi:MAG: hypothetical protein VYA11_03930 [Planctomycetota bacterium]|nr:hypothetical protein [Planctomycetota bacterium]
MCRFRFHNLAPFRVAFLMFGCGLFLLGSDRPVSAEDRAVQSSTSWQTLSSSLDRLEGWLKTSPYGTTWNAYLKTALLRRELAEGPDADLKALKDILARYRSGAAGLEKPRFAAVRTALAAYTVYLAAEVRLPVEKLPEVAQSAYKTFQPPSPAMIAAAESQTAEAADTLDRFLAQNPDRSEGWKAFILWPELQAQFSSDRPDTAKLAKVLQRLSADEAGLEKTQFVTLRHSLRSWIDRVLAEKKTAAVKKKIKAYSGELADRLRKSGVTSSHWDSMAIALRIQFLSRFGVAPDLTDAVRSHYSHPNLSAYISSELISSAMDRAIDEAIRIRENILGVQIVGEGQTKGSLKVDLLPDENRAAIGLNMRGVTESSTVGSKRSVRVFADSTTSLEGTKKVHFSGEGFTSQPARADATTETRVTGLTTRRGNPLVEKLAWRKVAQSKGQAQRQSSQRAARRLEERMNEEGDKLLADANQKYGEKFRAPLLRKDAFPRRFDVESDGSQIQLLMHEASPDQLGAPIAASLPPAGSDLAVRVHESFVNNMAAHLLGGKEVSSEDAKQKGDEPNFLERFKQQRQKKLAQQRASKGEEPLPTPQGSERPQGSQGESQEAGWQMRFAKRNPLSVEFRDGTIRFVIRGTEFSGLDEQVYDRPMSMWARYRVQQDNAGGLQLTLLGQGVDPTNVEKGGRFVAADAPLRSKLRVRWKETLEGKNGENKVVHVFPFEVPDPRFKQVGPLAYERLDLKDGWLTLGMQRTAGQLQKQARVDRSP